MNPCEAVSLGRFCRSQSCAGRYKPRYKFAGNPEQTASRLGTHDLMIYDKGYPSEYSYSRDDPSGRAEQALITATSCGHGTQTDSPFYDFGSVPCPLAAVFCQSLAGVDASGRAHAKRARRELFCLPARVLSHGRRFLLRLAPGLSARSFPPGLRAAASTAQLRQPLRTTVPPPGRRLLLRPSARASSTVASANAPR